VGGNFAVVDTLFAGSSGDAEIVSITFAYRQGREETVERTTPVLTRLLRLPPSDIPAAVKKAVADAALASRLRHEFATSYYTHITERHDPRGGEPRMVFDLESAARVESAEAVRAIQAAMEAAPEWFG